MREKRAVASSNRSLEGLGSIHRAAPPAAYSSHTLHSEQIWKAIFESEQGGQGTFSMRGEICPPWLESAEPPRSWWGVLKNSRGVRCGRGAAAAFAGSEGGCPTSGRCRRATKRRRRPFGCRLFQSPECPPAAGRPAAPVPVAPPVEVRLRLRRIDRSPSARSARRPLSASPHTPTPPPALDHLILLDLHAACNIARSLYTMHCLLPNTIQPITTVRFAIDEKRPPHNWQPDGRTAEPNRTLRSS